MNHPTTSDETEEIAVKDELEIDDSSHTNAAGPSSAPAASIATKSEPPELLSEYTCPICFSPPTNATMTPCGHVCCGACLFMAVKSALKRGGMNGEAAIARLVFQAQVACSLPIHHRADVLYVAHQSQTGTVKVVA